MTSFAPSKAPDKDKPKQPWKCPFCQLLIADEEEYYLHIDTCDKVFLFKVEILEDTSGSINLRKYNFLKGEVRLIWYELYRILDSQNKCRRLF